MKLLVIVLAVALCGCNKTHHGVTPTGISVLYVCSVDSEEPHFSNCVASGGRIAFRIETQDGPK